MKVLCSLKQFEKAKDTSNLAVVIQLRRKKGEPIRLMYGTMVDLAEKPRIVLTSDSLPNMMN